MLWTTSRALFFTMTIRSAAFQLERGGQWVKGKSADTFAPLGPFLATPDEIVDFAQLRMWLMVNGEIRQKMFYIEHDL
jgi:2-keto-4-pentenoate hydratase/2-oxohepta-3-ene-1,7-dioic acid hydratase in catechol pathway